TKPPLYTACRSMDIGRNTRIIGTSSGPRCCSLQMWHISYITNGLMKVGDEGGHERSDPVVPANTGLYPRDDCRAGDGGRGADSYGEGTDGPVPGQQNNGGQRVDRTCERTDHHARSRKGELRGGS